MGERGRNYTGQIVKDHYGRKIPKHAHGTENIDHYTSSAELMVAAVLRLYDRIVDSDLLIRRVTIAAENVIFENEIPDEEPIQLDFFTDFETAENERI